MALPRTGPADDGALLRALEDALGADWVRTDADTRHVYATDASPCVVDPRAVVFAQSEEDIIATLRVCREFGVPVTPRAAGTSLSGAAIGPGIVLDTSRLNRIREVDAGRGIVRVEPGILLAELNMHLADHGGRFAPDPGSYDLCRIGGMVGHNASGYRTVKYGQTRDHVRGLRVALVDGTVVEACDVRVDGPEWKDLVERVPAFESIRKDIEAHREGIRAMRRPVRKSSCGYDVGFIADTLEKGIFPLASLFVGSEGTLGIVTEATLCILPIPSRRMTLLVYLDRFEDLGPLAADILLLRPSAIEGMDGRSLDLLDREGLGIPTSAQAMLLVEFDEGDLEGIARTVTDEIGPKYAVSRPIELASDPGRQEALWKVRRSVLPKIIQRPGRRKAWGFVEDPVVPRERVPEFIAFLADLARRHGTEAGIYGHIGDGNTHFRPFFDPTDPEDFERMLALRAEFDDAVLSRFHGVLSGEHGIGRIRADVLSRIWGAEIYALMRRIKDALDPDGLLNPGVLFSSEPWWSTWAGLESRSPM